MKRVLIIISALNDGPSLAEFLPRLKGAIVRLPERCDVLVIDDGSSDNTHAVSKQNGCIVLKNRKNLGIGTSLRRGYRMAKRRDYDVTITIDADGQHDEKFIGTMLEELRRSADIVVASRYHWNSERIGVPFDRELLNIAFRAQIQTVTGWKVTDPLCGFWAMKRKWFEFALEHGRQTRYGIHLEHLIKMWHLPKTRPKLVEIPHPAIYGNHGTSSLLTRDYSVHNREGRIERFGTHALHIIEAIEDVKAQVGSEIVDAEIRKKRKK
jgi:glycosyltransferase involved in cell wall biosynthesis